MTDPSSTQQPGRPRGESDVDRDARIDELLLAGLDHYFAGRHQDAINVWGRVLFLDRGHARARAYIERARGALAEQQRRADEMVHEGVAALERGEGAAARELFSSAVARGDSQGMARSYLERLERLSGAQIGQTDGSPIKRRPTQERGRVPGSLLAGAPRPVRALPIIGLALLAAVAVLYATSRDLLKPLIDFKLTPAGAASAVVMPADALPVPRAAELALARARGMFASGQLKAALAALGGVPEADALSLEADRLRAAIQRSLIGVPQDEPEPPAVAATPASATGERRE